MGAEVFLSYGAVVDATFSFWSSDGTNGGALSPTHFLKNSSNALINPATAEGQAQILAALQTGGTGTGTPAEGSSVPTPLPGTSPLSTVAASTSRTGLWFFQNQSTVPLTLALDDGAGGGLSVFILAPGTGSTPQGGSMGNADTGPHLGRFRVYGAAGSAHALRVQ